MSRSKFSRAGLRSDGELAQDAERAVAADSFAFEPAEPTLPKGVMPMPIPYPIVGTTKENDADVQQQEWSIVFEQIQRVDVSLDRRSMQLNWDDGDAGDAIF